MMEDINEANNFSYEYQDLQWIKNHPANFELSDFVEPIYDPNVHLDIQIPEYLINLKFEKLIYNKLNLSDPNDKAILNEFLKPGLAYTAPFKILSNRGLETLRDIIEYHKNNTPQLSKHTNRQAWCMRGLGYVSKFIRDFNRCPIVANAMSIFSAKQLVSHGMPMNYSHINIGLPGAGKKVDQWHLDSVGYVLVIMISDTSNMIGGELQVVNRDSTDNVLEILNSHTDAYKQPEIMTVKYSEAGNGIFMQGSRIYHQVTSVIESPCPRISLVNSFMINNVFEEDSTKFSTFLAGDPQHIAPLECARYVAHRTQGILEYLLNNIEFDNPGETCPKKGKLAAIQILQKAIKELQNGYSLLKNDIDDQIGYFDDSKKKINLIEKN